MGGVQRERRGVVGDRPPDAGHRPPGRPAPSLSAAPCFLMKVGPTHALVGSARKLIANVWGVSVALLGVLPRAECSLP